MSQFDEKEVKKIKSQCKKALFQSTFLLRSFNSFYEPSENIFQVFPCPTNSDISYFLYTHV